MKSVSRVLLIAGVTLASLVVISQPAFAQVGLNGAWAGIFHEDQPHRNPGAQLGDYTGHPINDNARAFADAWNASRNTVSHAFVCGSPWLEEAQLWPPSRVWNTLTAPPGVTRSPAPSSGIT